MKTARYLHEWVNIRSIDLRPRTVESYRATIANHIVPMLGSVPLKRLTPEHIVPLLARLQATGHVRTAQLVYVILSAALRAAEDRDLIRRSPMRSIKKPSHQQAMRRYLTNAELATYTQAAFRDPNRVAWMLALLCGLRRGEICGLRWSDVDLTGNLLHIRNQRVRITGVGLRDAPPKSRAGCRSVPIPAVLLPLLQQGQQSSGYVVELQPEALDRAHRRMCITCGLPPVTPHGLRHTLASQGIRHGVHIKVLQCLLGHADFGTTANIYAHVEAEALSKAVSSLTGAIAAG